MTLPRSLVRRAQMAVRRTVTLADLMAQLAEVHGDAVMVTEELSCRAHTHAHLSRGGPSGRALVGRGRLLAAFRDVRW